MCLVDYFVGEVHYAIEPRLEVFQSTDAPINVGAEVEALQGRIGKFPMRAVEDVAVVHHLRIETGALGTVGHPVA